MADNPLGNSPDPNIAMATDNSNPLSRVPYTPTSVPRQPNPVDVQNAAVANADISHHYGIGKAFKSLIGDQTNYQIDPNTGQMVATPAKRSPGQLMRGILAGALLGSAKGAEGNDGSFVKGFARGGAAGVEDQRNQDLLRQKQAQQQFENQIKARRAGTEEDLMRAQIAMHNASTLRENQLTQFDKARFDRDTTEWRTKWPLESFKLHNESATLGNTQLKPYLDAGLPYFQKDISESEMLKLDPDAMKEHQKHLWEPTGVRMGTDKDGNPTYETTYSAVDPKGKVQLTDDWIAAAKKAGLDQVTGKATWDVLKKGKSLDFDQYSSLNKRLQDLTNTQTERRKKALDEEKENAEVAHFRAEAAELGARANLTKFQMEDAKTTKLALEEFSKGDGDLSKITDPKQRTAIQKFYLEQLKDYKDVYSVAARDNPMGPEAKEQYQKIQGVQAILDQFGGVNKKPAATVSGDKERVQVGDNVTYVDKNKLNDYLAANPDAKTGEDISVSPAQERSAAVAAMVGGSSVKFTHSGPPDASELPPEKSLFTDGKGNYIIRGKTFKNTQWKKVVDSTKPYMENPMAGP